MLLLGLDTSTMWSSVALCDEHGVVLGEGGFDASGRSNQLLIVIDRVCRDAAVTPSAIDAVAVGAGPGSFTGLRIGMATAKGIAFAAPCPLWLVSSLAALAAEAVAMPDARSRAVCAVIDARKGEVYAGCYTGSGAPIGDERVMPPEELAAWAEATAPGTAFAGNAIDSYSAALTSLSPRWLPAPRTPRASLVARLALAGPRIDALLGGAPTYIRPSEAEVMYPDGVPGALPSLQKA